MLTASCPGNNRSDFPFAADIFLYKCPEVDGPFLDFNQLEALLYLIADGFHFRRDGGIQFELVRIKLLPRACRCSKLGLVTAVFSL